MMNRNNLSPTEIQDLLENLNNIKQNANDPMIDQQAIDYSLQNQFSGHM